MEDLCRLLVKTGLTDENERQEHISKIISTLLSHGLALGDYAGPLATMWDKSSGDYKERFSRLMHAKSRAVELASQGMEPWQYKAERILLLAGEVTFGTGKALCKQLKLCYDSKDPVLLLIDSPGGSVRMGIDVLEKLLECNDSEDLPDIDTHVVRGGQASSIAALVLSGGKRRTAHHECGDILLHRASITFITVYILASTAIYNAVVYAIYGPSHPLNRYRSRNIILFGSDSSNSSEDEEDSSNSHGEEEEGGSKKGAAETEETDEAPPSTEEGQRKEMKGKEDAELIYHIFGDDSDEEEGVEEGDKEASEKVALIELRYIGPKSNRLERAQRDFRERTRDRGNQRAMGVSISGKRID